MHITVNRQLLKSLLLMGAVVEARDPYTGGHLWRVSQYAKLLAVELGLERDQIIQISLGGFLHDLGKVGIPDDILKKPSSLTTPEFAIIKTHPVIGADLIHDHPLAPLVYQAIRQHHERVDGGGYPDGLVLERISLGGRIVAIADAFDAMTSTRSYHAGMTIDQAAEELQQVHGQQFDGDILDEFLALAQSGVLGGIVQHSDEGVPLQVCPHCGPVIELPRDTREGDLVYCRVCGREMRAHRRGDALELEVTGRRGDAEALKPRPELGPIDDLVRHMPKTLHLEVREVEPAI